jgi:hypothetical protein
MTMGERPRYYADGTWHSGLHPFKVIEAWFCQCIA